MASQDLLFKFLALDAGAGREFDRMSRKASMTSGALKGLALGAAAAAAGVAVASVKAASSFQTEMTKLQTQAGKSAGEVKRMSAAMLSLAGPTATAPTELAKGLYHLESAGIHGARAIKAMQVAAEGAKLGGADLESVTNALNAAISSGIPGVKNMNQAMGYLNATVGEGDMRMQDLADALSTGVLAVVKGFGVSMRDASAALAVFGDNNIRGAAAGTDLRVAIQAMVKPAKTGVDILKAMGLQSDSLAKAMQHGGLNEALHLLKSHMDAAGVSGKQVGQVITEAFGRKSSAALAILEGQMGRFDQKFRQSQQAAKGFGSSWQGYTKTFAYRFDQMRAAVQVLAIKLGNVLLPAATALAKYITQHIIPALSAVGGWVKRNSGWLGPLAKDITAVYLAFKALTLISKAYAGVAALVTVGLGREAAAGTVAAASARRSAAADLEAAAAANRRKAALLGLANVGVAVAIGAQWAYGKTQQANAKSEAAIEAYASKGGKALQSVKNDYVKTALAAQHASGFQKAALEELASQFKTALTNVGVDLSQFDSQLGISTGAVQSFAYQSSSAMDALANSAWGAFYAIGNALGAAPSGKGPKYAPGARRAGDTFSTGQATSGAVVASIKTKAPQMSQALADALAGTSPGGAGTAAGSTGKKAGKSVAKGIDQALQAHMSKFKTDLSNARQFQSSLQSSLAGYAALSNNTGGTDSLGAAMTPPSVQSYLRTKARSLERFVHLLKRLDHLGLSRNLLEQFANIGPDAIPAMQQLLASGRKGIRTADRLERQVEKYAGQAAVMVTRDHYGKVLHEDLEKLPDKIARRLGDRIQHMHLEVNVVTTARHHGRRVRSL